MNEQQRYDLLMSTKVGEIISDSHKKFLLENGFFTAPASTKYHGNYLGGLFDHSFTVMNCLVELSAKNNIKWQRAESPFIVGIFHDLCKIDSYVSVTNPTDGEISFKHNDKTSLKGHGDKSIMLLCQHLQLTEEEVMCIRYHMGAFTDSSEWSDYTGAVNKYPNVLWTHHADMIASHIIGV